MTLSEASIAMSDDPVPPSTPQRVGNGIRARGARTECASCGEVFAGVGPFDAHRTGPHPERRCLSRTEIAAAFTTDARGYWTR